MERWIMNKLGFVNFWVYDTEEFPFRDGKLLLRGLNGSGKSITTQSCIPYILDGDRTPSRLDPFGTKDRKMEYYLLGDPENGKEESTGYIYLEFKKPKSGQYRTVGIGLHAKKGSKMSTWGFCILDGRRVGFEIMLYREAGTEKIPLDAKRLREQLGDKNPFTEKPTEYKAIVAKHIFDIDADNLSDFEQLTNILIKTRSSKLASKENLKPEQLYAILNESLQTLSEEELRPMVDAMNKIEEIHHRIDEAQNVLREVKAVSAEYDRYNKYMLWIKADAYLKKHRETSEATADMNECGDKIKSSSDEKAEAENNLLNLNTRLDDLERERKSLNDNDIKNKLDEKKGAADKLSVKKSELKKKNSEIEDKENKLKSNYGKQREAKQNISDVEYEIKKQTDELQGYEVVPPLHNNYIGKIKTDNEFFRQSNQCAKEINAYRNKLTDILNLIGKRDEAKENLDTAEKRFDDAKRVEDDVRSSLKTAQKLFDEEKDRIIESFYRAAKGNTEYLIDENMLSKIEALISEYNGQEEGGELLRMLASHKSYIESKLQKIIAERKAICEKAKEDLNASTLELEKMKNTSEPVPERSEQRINARRVLTEKGIEFRSFYECIDFKDGLDDETKAVIEAEISDMGLLDALVVSKNSVESAMKELGALSEHIVISDSEFAEYESPFFEIAESCEFKSEVSAIIGALLGNNNLRVKISADGYYKNGIIEGHSSNEIGAGFIGAENRKKYRERQIEALSQKCAELLSAYNDRSEELDNARSRLDVMNSEYEALPITVNIDVALSQVRDFSNKLELCVVKTAAEEKAYISAKQIHENRRSLLEAESKDIPYRKNAETYGAAIKDIDFYSEKIQSIFEQLLIKYELGITADGIAEMIDSLKENIDSLSLDLKNINGEIHGFEEVIRLCDEFLNRPENADIAKRAIELDEEIKSVSEKISDAKDTISTCKATVLHLSEQLEKSKEKVQKLIEDETITASYFKEECRLGFVIEDSSLTLGQCAEIAEKSVSSEDKSEEPSKLQQDLNNAFRNHFSGCAAEYNPTIDDTVFDKSENGSTRKRSIVELTWYGKKMSPACFETEIQQTAEEAKLLLKDEEEKMFTETLMDTVSKKLYYRINSSKKWVEAMAGLMQDINTSMRLSFSLSWKPRKDIDGVQLEFKDLLRILNMNKELVRQEDFEKLSAYFRDRIEAEKRSIEERGEEINYSELIKTVLDYRKWFEFRLLCRSAGADKFSELTVSRFNTFSGGERALSLYIPLFAAVAAQYEKAGEQAPKILALDEAFAGVDDCNINEMFGLLERLGFGYIVNSQALWGCYDTVPSLGIAELNHEINSDIISVILYEWNGKRKTLIN